MRKELAMYRSSSRLFFAAMLFWPVCAAAADAQPMKKYFAHPAVEDRDGVIAPWYQGQNGQCDFRARIAAETLKRYPWTDKSMAVMAAPYFVFSGSLGHQARRNHRRQPQARRLDERRRRSAVREHAVGTWRIIATRAIRRPSA